MQSIDCVGTTQRVGAVLGLLVLLGSGEGWPGASLESQRIAPIATRQSRNVQPDSTRILREAMIGVRNFTRPVQ